MSETTLWLIESFVAGLCLGGVAVMALWAWDSRDYVRRLAKRAEDSYWLGYSKGYEAGGRLRFRERCRIERRCRQLEKMIREQDDGQKANEV